eukprot:6006400-Pyramimonas_sp.AAC.1
MLVVTASDWSVVRTCSWLLRPKLWAAAMKCVILNVHHPRYVVKLIKVTKAYATEAGVAPVPEVIHAIDAILQVDTLNPN